MSRPARPYAPDPFHPDVVDPCCDDNRPAPRWVNYAAQIIAENVFRGGYHGTDATLEAEARARCIAAYENPDRLWCARCSTALEDIRDEFEDVLPALLELVATIASFFPGIGTVVADIAGTAAALAEGESISDALIDGALSAIPGGPVWAGVARAGRDILDGQRVDRSLLDGTRAAIAYEGGPLAAAAFDAVMALAQGKSIQDAGFSGLKALASGNSLAERAANFAEAVTVAAEQGRSVTDVLVRELVTDALAAGGGNATALIAGVVGRIKVDPSLLEMGSGALALAMGVAEPIARAAQATMRSGTEDTSIAAAVHAAYLYTLTVSGSAGGTANAQRAVYALSTPAQKAAINAASARAVLIASPVHAAPAILAAAGARVSAAIGLKPSVVVPTPAPLPPPALVKTTAPVKATAPAASSAPSSMATNVLIGGTALGALAVALWFASDD